MKKQIAILMAGICTMTLLVGCGGAASDSNITINKYKGLTIEKIEAVEVTDAAVEESIKSDLEILATEEKVTDRPAQMGDITIIDFVGKKDGVAFAGGSATDSELELGSGKFIPGFEQGIVGKNIGETFNLNLTFPDTYQNNPDLAGEDVVFTVTLKEITAKIIPELTADILPEIGTSATTVEEYKAEVKKNLETSNAKTAEESVKAAIKEALLKQCKAKKYPEDILIEATKDFVFQESYGAMMSGVSIDDYVAQNYDNKTVNDKAKEGALYKMAIELIGKKEKLTITSAKYDAAVKELATQYGYTDIDQFVTAYEGIYGKNYIKDSLLEDAVLQFLIKNCKQVKTK